jgi:hypothetical protein
VPIVEIRHGTLLAHCGRTVTRTGWALISPTAFDLYGVIFGADRIQEGPLYLVLYRLQVLTAYENGVENVVAFVTDGISAPAARRSGTKRSARASSSTLTRFRC